MGWLYDGNMHTNNGYEIRVMGHLDQHWRAWFEDWTITDLENGETLLKSTKIDQPGVHSVLNKIRDLNLEFVSVIRISAKVDNEGS